MKVFVLDITPLAGREMEILGAIAPSRRGKALRLRAGEARLQSLGAGLLLRHAFGQREITLSPGGKPCIPGERAFSLSHSGRWAVLAVEDTAVGADIQTLAQGSEALRRRVLTPGELQWLDRAGERGFAALWSRKEAALKLLGGGIDRAMNSFEVLPGMEPVLEGKSIFLATLPWQETMLSLAGLSSFTPAVETLSAADILSEVGPWN